MSLKHYFYQKFLDGFFSEFFFVWGLKWMPNKVLKVSRRCLLSFFSYQENTGGGGNTFFLFLGGGNTYPPPPTPSPTRGQTELGGSDGLGKYERYRAGLNWMSSDRQGWALTVRGRDVSWVLSGRTGLRRLWQCSRESDTIRPPWTPRCRRQPTAAPLSRTAPLTTSRDPDLAWPGHGAGYGDATTTAASPLAAGLQHRMQWKYSLAGHYSL